MHDIDEEGGRCVGLHSFLIARILLWPLRLQRFLQRPHLLLLPHLSPLRNLNVLSHNFLISHFPNQIPPLPSSIPQLHTLKYRPLQPTIHYIAIVKITPLHLARLDISILKHAPLGLRTLGYRGEIRLASRYVALIAENAVGGCGALDHAAIADGAIRQVRAVNEGIRDDSVRAGDGAAIEVGEGHGGVFYSRAVEVTVRDVGIVEGAAVDGGFSGFGAGCG